ncbi:hypothetical protein NFI96_005648 [Prochilodus magdalenae]|nr:hypothetical protein NFI96_005648 [Prochilodus magdalenae]
MRSKVRRVILNLIAALGEGMEGMCCDDAQRAVHAPSRITDKVLEMFRSKSEFTFMASIQQKASTSGVLFSIHEAEHRLLIRPAMYRNSSPV